MKTADNSLEAGAILVKDIVTTHKGDIEFVGSDGKGMATTVWHILNV